jgi:transcription initiation factor IIE alpha subunit
VEESKAQSKTPETVVYIEYPESRTVLNKVLYRVVFNEIELLVFLLENLSSDRYFIKENN